MALKLLVIQPTPFCNLNCKYCYLPKAKRLNKEKISEEILEEIFRKVLQSRSIINEELQILWLAGEPLAAGLELFYKAMRFIDHYNRFQVVVKNAIQTNGTLINQQWCNFFKSYNFQIGISLDGPSFIHDKNRLNWVEQGSYERVIKGINILKENGITFNGLCTLTRESLKYPDKIFQLFYNLGFNAIGFNTVQVKVANTNTDLMNHDKNINRDIEQNYKDFISRIYDLYVTHNQKMQIREFKDILQTLSLKLDFPSYQKRCGPNIGMEILTIKANGEISTFCPEMADGIEDNNNMFSIGNIKSIEDLEELFRNKNYIELKLQIEKGVKQCIQNCNYFDYCGGGYPSNKFYELGSLCTTETNQCRFQIKIIKDLIVQKLSV
jgi:uncharacterized protein